MAYGLPIFIALLIKMKISIGIEILYVWKTLRYDDGKRR